jgi:hypothetical protein
MVMVDPAQPPRQLASRASVAHPLLVASPAVYLAPEHISDAELLGQSVVLALLEDLKAQRLLRYDHAVSPQEQAQQARVTQVLNGMQLWQLWEGDLPLASWRVPLVQWVMRDARPELPARGEVVPSFRSELCAMHQLWMITPFALNIPLSCHDSLDQADRVLAWRLAYEPPLRLAHFPIVTLEMLTQNYQMARSGWDHPATAVALATVMEYTSATYGLEPIPLLIEEAGRHESWATLIPAVFGVSMEEFEAGWQIYLAEQYGVY